MPPQDPNQPPQVSDPSVSQQPYAAPQPQPPVNPAPYGPPPASGGNKKMLIIGLLVGGVILLLLIGGVIFAASKSVKKAEQSTSVAPSQSEEASSLSDEVKPEQKQKQEVILNKSFKDDAGYNTTATRIIRNYPASSEFSAERLAEKKMELVVVEYTIKNEGEFKSAAPSKLRLQLKASDGELYGNSYDVDPEDLEAAGLKELNTSSLDPGGSTTGVVVYEVPQDDKLSVYYKLKVNVIGGDDIDKEYTLALY